MALPLLADYWAAYNLSPRVFAVIGNGYGFLGALIRRHFPSSRVYRVDLPRILLFHAHIHAIAGGGESMSIILSGSVKPGAVTFVQLKDIEAIFCILRVQYALYPENERIPHIVLFQFPSKA